jgi:predicted PurR-regulated permease PerM
VPIFGNSAPREYISCLVPLLDARISRATFTILLIAAALGFVWLAWQTLLAFLFAIFFAYLIEPVVQFAIAHLKMTRGKAIALVYLIMSVALSVLFLFVGPGMVQSAQKLFNSVPTLYQKIATGQIAWQLGAEHGWSYATRLKIQHFLVAYSSSINSFATNTAERIARVGAYAWWIIVIPILAAFFLRDGDQISQTLVDIFERRRQREFLEGVLGDIHLMLVHFIRAQLTLAALAMAVFIAGLALLRVPYGVILGVVGGFLEFIPVLGPLVSSLLIMGVALGTGYHHLLVLMVFLGVWRCIQDYVNAPHIMGNKMELHPLAALFGVLAGAEIGGIIGVYLSIPVMASVRIFFRRWQLYAHQRVVPATEATVLPPISEPSDQGNALSA